MSKVRSPLHQGTRAWAGVGRTASMDARALTRILQRLVAAAVPAAALSVAAVSCSGTSSSSPEYRCSPQSQEYVETHLCAAPPVDQATADRGDTGSRDAVSPETGSPSAGRSCEEQCRGELTGNCTIREKNPGVCMVECVVTTYHACGRCPAGFVPRARRRTRPTRPTRPTRYTQESDAVGAFLAGAAELEAASVVAFQVLSHELELHGAPARLVEAARKSARDEVQHTRVMTTLAARFGGTFIAPEIARRRPRSLRAMARENAVEGCVRETYGALVATYQASHAADPRVRRAMRSIAADETSHAALAWSVAAWAEGRLDSTGARAIRASMHEAGRALLREVSAPPPASTAEALGLPDADTAKRLARGLLLALGISERIEP